MKKLTTLLISLTTAIIILSFYNVKNIESRQFVNPILGDISFVNKFGYLPDETTDNELRIRTHLEYVENLLRQKDVSGLAAKQQVKRNQLLDLLHDYWTAGIFPRNYDYADQRKPCFIDKDNRICAVGYLVEQTASRQDAEQINSKHKYEKIYEMNDAVVDDWIANSGMTKEEVAMIQPTYGSTAVETYNFISPGNGFASALFSGVNLSLNTINGIQISNGTTSKAVPIVGLVTGAGQIIYAAIAFPEEPETWGGINESLRSLCYINIGLGTATMILSSWNLAKNSKPKNKQTAWNIYNFQTSDNKVGLAFSLTRKF